MKQEITSLINSKKGMIRINQLCTLHRWTSNPVESNLDKLEVRFSITHFHSHSYLIKSRDWQGVVAEIQARQLEAFNTAATELNRRLQGGELFSNKVYEDD